MEEKLPTDSLVSSSQTPSPAPSFSWDSLGLSTEALDLITKAGFRSPTPVQAESIPIALRGEDLIASAQTGTGKTASFVLPMVEKFAGREGTYGLILAPTRELAQQTQATMELFGAPRGIRSCVLIGGIDMKLDVAALNTYPQIIIATPGRLCDHLDRGNIWLDYIEVVVLDEADRMLDMGFADQLSRIMQDVPAKRQTLLFSATMAKSVMNLANKILKTPKTVAIGKANSASTSVDQRLLFMSESSKNRELRRLLREETGSVIVFTRSKDKATQVWRSLHSAGVYDATYIHSDRRQEDREQALAEFKEGKYRILIATDVAGRGIHVDAIAQVINYDLPMDPEDYVHRIGRTGRADASGKATSFVTPQDKRILAEITKILGKEIPGENADGFDPNADHRSEASGRGGRDSRGGRSSGDRGGRGESRGGGRGAPRGDSKPAKPAPRPSAPRAAAQNSAPISAADSLYTHATESEKEFTKKPRGPKEPRRDGAPAKVSSNGQAKPQAGRSAEPKGPRTAPPANPNTFYRTPGVVVGASSSSTGGVAPKALKAEKPAEKKGLVKAVFGLLKKLKS